MQIRLDDSDMFNALGRAALLVAVVFRMLIGLGLSIALIVKVYMLVFTDFTCQAETVSLGNTILCTPTLDLIAASIFLVTGFGFAVALISTRAVHLRETLLMALCGVFVAFISGISVSNASWEIAMVVIALFVPIGGLVTLSRVFNSEGAASDPQEEK